MPDAYQTWGVQRIARMPELPGRAWLMKEDANAVTEAMTVHTYDVPYQRHAWANSIAVPQHQARRTWHRLEALGWRVTPPKWLALGLNRNPPRTEICETGAWVRISAPASRAAEAIASASRPMPPST